MENNWLKKNIRKVATIGMAAVGSMAMHNADAQGLFHKKDKHQEPTEQKANPTPEKSPSEKDFENFQAKYKSDSLNYRAVAVGVSMDQQEAINQAMDNAHSQLMSEAHSENATFRNVRKIDSSTYKLSDGTYKTIVVVEVSKDNGGGSK